MVEKCTKPKKHLKAVFRILATDDRSVSQLRTSISVFEFGFFS